AGEDRRRGSRRGRRAAGEGRLPGLRREAADQGRHRVLGRVHEQVRHVREGRTGRREADPAVTRTTLRAAPPGARRLVNRLLAILVALVLWHLFARGPGSASGFPTPLESAESAAGLDRKSTRLNSSHVKISYAVFCL